MKNTSLKISIVIPAYNEQDHIASCLKAIASLDVKPYEVIVVDNKSTDNTAKTAEQFPFVSVIKEARQGVVYARDRGFNYASGDIIGRIDVDTHLPSNWTAKVLEIFKDNTVQAVSGSLHFYDVAFSKLFDRVEGFFRGWMAKKMTPNQRIFLLGANMAIRRESWLKVRHSLCHAKGIHEDLDLALHMSADSLKVAYEPGLKANLSVRRIDSSFIEAVKYCSRSPLTYFKHKAKEHRYMYPIIVLALVFFYFFKFSYRAYNSQTERLEIKRLILSQTATRVNPADFMQV